MLINLFRICIGFIGTIVGYVFFKLAVTLELINIKETTLEGMMHSSAMVICSLLFGLLFLIFSKRPATELKNLVEMIERHMHRYSVMSLWYSAVGLLIGVVLAYFFSRPLWANFGYFGVIGSIFVYLILAYFGWMAPQKYPASASDDAASRKDGSLPAEGGIPKVVDTSSIIDGRIADICKTGFVEGPLIIPNFVLMELQHIADSQDSLKRRRGRRGLDILKKLQTELPIETVIVYDDYEEIAAVDAKLVRLALDLKGCVITNDFNLNKVADVQGLKVLNINELANAIKAVVLPGEEMEILIAKDGKEPGQGLGFLDDGTMIVVENGKQYIGMKIEVEVTTALQTQAGRMIFARPKNDSESGNEQEG